MDVEGILYWGGVFVVMSALSIAMGLISQAFLRLQSQPRWVKAMNYGGALFGGFAGLFILPYLGFETVWNFLLYLFMSLTGALIFAALARKREQ